MSRKNRDFFREKSEFLRDRLLLLFIDIARRGLLIAYVLGIGITITIQRFLDKGK